jgi:choline dehydrogenase-like flavoprotein
MPWSADVVIVGSGVAGSLVAARLTKAGVKVLILEAGPRVERAVALAQYRDALIKIPESPYPDAPYAPHPVSDNPDHYYLQDGPDKFASPYLRQVGGTTWHWLGTAMRFVPDDFKLRSKFGVGLDWPLSYEDLESWYCEAERELGVAGDPNADLGAPRSQPYPMPAIPLSYGDRRTAAALESISGTPYTVHRRRRRATLSVTTTVPPAAATAVAFRSAPCRRSTTRRRTWRRRSAPARRWSRRRSSPTSISDRTAASSR